MVVWLSLVPRVDELGEGRAAAWRERKVDGVVARVKFSPPRGRPARTTTEGKAARMKHASDSGALPANVEQQRTRVSVDQDAPRHTSTVEYAGAYYGSGVDNSFSMERFARDFKIEIKSLYEEEMVFDMIGIDPAIANAFRRILLSEVRVRVRVSDFFTFDPDFQENNPHPDPDPNPDPDPSRSRGERACSAAMSFSSSLTSSACLGCGLRLG